MTGGTDRFRCFLVDCAERVLGMSKFCPRYAISARGSGRFCDAITGDLASVADLALEALVVDRKLLLVRSIDSFVFVTVPFAPSELLRVDLRSRIIGECVYDSIFVKK